MINQISLGEDPELHMFDNEEGRVVSALRIFKGRNKNHPINLGDGIKMYPDNVLLECAHPPCNSIDSIIDTTRIVFARMQERIGKRFSLWAKAAHVYDPMELKGKKCWETGCRPNADAYLMVDNKPAKFTDGLRTGSFHLHLGHPNANTLNEKVDIVKLMDVFVGCASVIFDKDETAPLRRALYGRAGEFRQTPYGVEYRVLGNWALRSPVTTRLVWELTMYALTMWEIGEAKSILEAVGPTRVQRAINNNNKVQATEVLEIAGTPYTVLGKIEKDYGTLEFRKAWGI